MESDDISLEERVEALEQYMSVAQMKIMALQDAVNALLFASEIDDEKAKKFMGNVMNNFGRHK
jgi:hypothetical protein